ncbi:LytTR family DNA-binding domain-containing protein [Brevundimonas variabilis]|uniref:DNA-binding LytR/AlgR family response regulator n=1 Tax=Brevundimonas variabilis TaxID=74312 RepID=A0A7W9CGZ2_9CAUL|nr:LytTR family DNA-binding domain-containing protein [Brevundimonas variabilis]MBB5745007.1 DNA-binding LytR/AlgR family response regulator [Brevundimonas variabilis]
MTSKSPFARLDPSLSRGLLVAGVGGIVLALTGAFMGTDQPVLLRLAYWIPIMLCGAVWGHLCSGWVERYVNLDEQPWRAVLALVLVISGPLTVFVWAASGLAFSGRLYPLAAMADVGFAVVVVTATMSMVNVFLAKAQPVQTHAAPVGTAPARFPDRLPLKMRGAAIRAVQAEDHYLRIHTDRGSDLILMRLSDALEELEGLEGAQTHRSWWVARGAVRDVSRGDGRATLTLDGGLQAPVSRRYAKALRDAGWY